MALWSVVRYTGHSDNDSAVANVIVSRAWLKQCLVGHEYYLGDDQEGSVCYLLGNCLTPQTIETSAIPIIIDTTTITILGGYRQDSGFVFFHIFCYWKDDSNSIAYRTLRFNSEFTRAVQFSPH